MVSKAFRVMWTELAIAAGLTKSMYYDEPWKKGIVYTGTALTVAGIWFPGIKERLGLALAPLAVNPYTAAVAAPVAAGSIASYAIADVEGLRDYHEYMYDVFSGDVGGVWNKWSFTYDELVEKRAGPRVWEAINKFPSQLKTAGKKIFDLHRGIPIS